jgi:hypothetical protein
LSDAGIGDTFSDDTGGGDMPKAPPPIDFDMAIPPPDKYAVVYMLNYPSTIQAAFTTDPHCVKATIGACTTEKCPVTPTATTLNAGPITITGTQPSVILKINTTGRYTGFLGTTALWQGGETITASAPGATASPFTLMVRAPTTIKVTSPAAPTSGQMTINRGQPFVAHLSGSTAGSIAFLATSTDATNTYRATVNCLYPGSATSFTVPASALAVLPAGTNGSSVEISSSSASSTRSGEWSIVMSATSDAQATSGLFTFPAIIN